jgi:hypothetical protein
MLIVIVRSCGADANKHPKQKHPPRVGAHEETTDYIIIGGFVILSSAPNLQTRELAGRLQI